MIFVFLYPAYFTQYDNLYVHTCHCKWHHFILLWLSNIPLYICTASSLSRPQLMDLYDCFHVLAIINSAAMIIGVHVSFQFMIFSRYMPGVGFLHHIVVLSFCE